jgi:hypothetical protein
VTPEARSQGRARAARARRTSICVLLALIALLALGPGVARAGPILDPQDGVDLAQTLADAREEQDVCYGWEIEVDDGEAGTVETDMGSSLGPDRPVDPAQCPRAVVLRGAITFTSETSEAEDSVDAFTIESTLPRPPTVEQIAALGLSQDRLLDDDSDVALTDMVNVLPLLVAEAGQAEYVPYEEPTTPPPAADRPDEGPSGDWIRMYWWLPVLGLLLVVGAVVLIRSALSGRSGGGSAAPTA